MIRRWLALTYYLYALRLAALSHFYFNPLYCAESGQCFTVERGAAPPERPALRFAGNEPLPLFAHEPPVVQAALAEGLPDGGEKAFFVGVDVLLVEQGVAGLGALRQAVQKQMRVFRRGVPCGAFVLPCRPVVRLGGGV